MLSLSLSILSGVILRWNGQWTDLIFPVNCILLHASVAVLALTLRRARKTSPCPEIQGKSV